MTLFGDLYANQTLIIRFIPTMRGIISTNFEFIINVYVFNSNYKNRLLLYRLFKTQTLRIPHTMSKELADLITRLLERDEERRLSVEEIKDHPFFNVSSFPIYVIIQ
jgi:serine/threonine protein kinase